MRIINKSSFTKRVMAGAFLTLAALGTCSLATAATINWKGQVWEVTGAEPIGAPSNGQINGNTSNVSVDSNGYLHVKITQSGGTFTGAQLFTQNNLGFGTYQFQIEADLANLEKGVVLGLFPYGPTAGIGVDGENEIDIEFSKWNDPGSGNNADFTYYPQTGHGDSNYTPSFEHNFFVNFGGATQTTSRIEWTPTSINSTIMTGFQPVGTTANVISPNDYYAPSNPSIKIPQQALPLGINLWTYGSKPTKALDIVIRDFTFVPMCTSNCTSSSKSSSSKSSTVTVSSKSSSSSVVSGGQQCNWYGTIYAICKTVTSGWGWENNTDCVSASTCATLPAPYGIIGGGSSASSSVKSSVKSSSSSSTSGSFTKLIQAESYSNMSGVQLEATSDVDGGQNVGWIDAADWMSYANINFPTSGSYKVEYRVASQSGGGILSLDLNAGAIQLGQLNVPSTGNWQSWTTISHTVNITAGTYSLGIYAAQGGWNINWIKITKL